jgi:enoyl-CoA hydratase/carnithine racemase
VRQEGPVWFAEIAALPMNLLGPELVRDLVSLIQGAEADDEVRVLVFSSGDPEYFISHVDLTRIAEYLAQFEPAFGELPGGGAAQHLTRLMGRGRALEVMLSAQDYDAELAERYGWINRALPAAELAQFVSALAHRIAGFPAAAHAAVKDRVNAIALAPAADFRRDSDLFDAGVREPEAQARIQAAMQRGLQTRDAELDFARVLG